MRQIDTKAAYRSDWFRVTTWAGAGGFPSLPAPPLVVCLAVVGKPVEDLLTL